MSTIQGVYNSSSKLTTSREGLSAHRSANTPQIKAHTQSYVRFAGLLSKIEAPSYEVAIPPEAVVEKLKTKIDLKKVDFWSTQGGRSRYGGDANKGFYGEIEGNSFRVMKKRWYNHGSAPMLEGKVEATTQGSKITTQWNRLPSGKALIKGFLGGSIVASLVTLPILAVKAMKGNVTPDEAIALTMPTQIFTIFMGVETPLTRHEKRAIKTMMDETFNPKTA